ncbi:hypothetical protein QBC42DRAFT_253093 [Cladorrhinum samala]|uniref:Uncharacterized protein n=1 Tax=Cladorrhinum samala TaxID=585594 RepID=A0AAV9HL61_9PEZI|nr:hypothetical protein QBC42DRAFT_253093 [Cladorrhinum samala]
MCVIKITNYACGHQHRKQPEHCRAYFGGLGLRSIMSGSKPDCGQVSYRYIDASNSYCSEKCASKIREKRKERLVQNGRAFVERQEAARRKLEEEEKRSRSRTPHETRTYPPILGSRQTTRMAPPVQRSSERRAPPRLADRPLISQQSMPIRAEPPRTRPPPRLADRPLLPGSLPSERLNNLDRARVRINDARAFQPREPSSDRGNINKRPVVVTKNLREQFLRPSEGSIETAIPTNPSNPPSSLYSIPLAHIPSSGRGPPVPPKDIQPQIKQVRNPQNPRQVPLTKHSDITPEPLFAGRQKPVRKTAPSATSRRPPPPPVSRTTYTNPSRNQKKTKEAGFFSSSFWFKT